MRRLRPKFSHKSEPQSTSKNVSNQKQNSYRFQWCSRGIERWRIESKFSNYSSKHSYWWRCVEKVLKMSWRRLQRNIFSSSKMSSRRVCKTSSCRCLEEVVFESSANEISKKFSREIRRCSIHDAIKLQTDILKNDILPLTEKTLQQLKQKYPPRCNADPDVLLPDKPEEAHPIKFASIDVESVRKATLKT